MSTSYDMLLFLSNLRGWEWVIIIGAILLLFGGRKLPELMRNLGKGVRGFKEGIKDAGDEFRKGLDGDDKPDEKH